MSKDFIFLKYKNEKTTYDELYEQLKKIHKENLKISFEEKYCIKKIKIIFTINKNKRVILDFSLDKGRELIDEMWNQYNKS